MEKFLSLTISGAVSGALYSIIASGLVLAYTTSGIFNFAQGAVAFTAAYLFYELTTGLGWPIAAAAVIAIIVYPVLMGLVLDRLMFRPLATASGEIKIVATVGLVLALPAFSLWLVERMVNVFHWNIPTGSNVFVAPGLGPAPKKSWNIFGTVVIDSNQLIVFGAALASAIILWFVVQRTRLGLEMRATVDKKDLASLRGIDPNRTSSLAWILSMMLAGLAGVVGAPIFGLAPGQYTIILFLSATAAVLGGLRSIPLAFAGGLLLGILQNLIAGYPPAFLDDLPGLRSALPSLFLLLALMVLGRDSLRKAGVNAEERPSSTPTLDLPPWRRSLPWVVFVVGLVVYTVFVADRFWVGLITKGLGLSLVFLSIVIVTGVGGMVSLAQATFVGAGALTAGLAMSHGWPFLPALLVGAGVAMLAGLIVAAVGIRLGGLPLALATLALALFADQLLFQLDWFRGGPSGWTVSRPDLGVVDLTSDRAMALTLLVVVGIGMLVVRNLERSSTGRAMLALRSSEAAAEASGISAFRTRLAIFGVSAAMAGVGGVMIAAYEGRVSNLSYVAADGLIWLAVVVTFGVRRPGAALVGGVVFACGPELVGYITDSGRVPAILFGLGAINLAWNPDGSIAQFAQLTRARRDARRLRQLEPDAPPADAVEMGGAPAAGAEQAAPVVERVRPRASTDPVLTARGVDAGYGDAKVLHAVDLELERGSVTALLGVNGAGKSTLCSVLAGLMAPTAGTIEAVGTDLVDRASHKRARGGIVLAPEGRGTFPSLAVDENLEIWLPSAAERDEAYERFPMLGKRRRLLAGNLSGGEQQILSLAPLLVRRPEVLLVDEPTLGLAPLVVSDVFEVFGELRAQGVTLLLAEEKVHDVLGIADRVVFLHLGRVLWDLPRDHVDDALLADAFLGVATPPSPGAGGAADREVRR